MADGVMSPMQYRLQRIEGRVSCFGAADSINATDLEVLMLALLQELRGVRADSTAMLTALERLVAQGEENSFQPMRSGAVSSEGARNE